MKYEADFLRAIENSLGYAPDNIKETGRMQRFSTKDNGRGDAGWCVFHTEGDRAGGAFGDWRTSEHTTWTSSNCTPEQKRTMQRKGVEGQKKQQAMLHKEVREKLQGMPLGPLIETPYTLRKQIDITLPAISDKAGSNSDGTKLNINMFDIHGTRVNVQTIKDTPTELGQKRFMRGGRTSEAFTILGAPTPRIFICEGFATSCSVHQATGDMVVCAFASGNVMDVTRLIKTQSPAATVIIATDNDHAGIDAARKSAQLADNLQCLPPEHNTDWNDYLCEHGKEQTCAAIKERVSEVPELSVGKPVPDASETPSVDSSPIASLRATVKPILLDPTPVPWSRTGLPEVIADCAEASAAATGSDPWLFASPAIAVLAAAVHDMTKVNLKRTENYTQRACIWATTLATSGAGKSPMASKACAPLREIERDLLPKAREMREAYNVELKKRASTIKDIEKGEDIPIPPPVNPLDYEQPRLVLQDITIEGVCKVQQFWNGGSVIIADELAALMGGFDRYAAGGAGKDASVMLTAYDGGPYQIDRKQDGATTVENLSLGIIGGIQPAVAAQMFKATGSNGFIERHLLSVAGPRRLPDESVSDLEPLAKWDATVKRAYQRGLRKAELQLSAGADRVRVKLNHWVFKQSRSEYEGLNSALNKYSALFGRLLIVWHFADAAGFDDDTEISEETAQLVYDFLTQNQYLHTKSAFEFFGEAKDYTPELVRICRYLSVYPDETITTEELRSICSTMTTSKLRDIVAFLVSRDYLIQDGTIGVYAVAKV